MHEWLLDKVSALGVNHWVDLLDTAFPPTSNVSYAKAETLGEPGSKKLRLWMLGIHPDSGNSGMMVNDGAETLVQLICVYGFRAEADKMIGVEMFTGKTTEQSFPTGARPMRRKPTWLESTVSGTTAETLSNTHSCKL